MRKIKRFQFQKDQESNIASKITTITNSLIIMDTIKKILLMEMGFLFTQIVTIILENGKDLKLMEKELINIFKE